jgi:hypothetical protein
MASKAVRRRPADKGSDKVMETTTTPDSVTEPLLGNTTQGSKSEVSNNAPLSSFNLGFLAFCDLLMSSIMCFLQGYEHTIRPDLWDGKTHQCLHWAHIVSDFITQSAKRIGNYHWRHFRKKTGYILY